MTWVFGKRLQQKLPQHCDLCHDPIGMYQPWYSILVNGHFVNDDVKDDLAILCPDCFHAYEDFLLEREVNATHVREMNETRNPDE